MRIVNIIFFGCIQIFEYYHFHYNVSTMMKLNCSLFDEKMIIPSFAQILNLIVTQAIDNRVRNIDQIKKTDNASNVLTKVTEAFIMY